MGHLKNAVVVGAGVGGLAAAGALADHFENVILLERDELPPGPRSRSGVPQSSQIHNMLLGGLSALCEIFPGIDQDLTDAGAVHCRINLDRREEWPGYETFPRRDLGWHVYNMSRPLIEFVLRERVMKLPAVRLRAKCRVIDLVAAEDGSVVGVRCENADRARETIPADLVIDASGRGALTLAFLKATGRPEPEISTVGIDVSYATTTFELPAGTRDWKQVITYPEFPDHIRGGVLMLIEGNRWQALVGHRHAEAPPANLAGFLEFSRELRTPTIYNAIKDAIPLDVIHRYGFPESRWVHYERIGDFPPGLLPLGDAISHFNPIYGQGMTVAAKQAALLKTLLQDRAGAADRSNELWPIFFLKEAASMVSVAWTMSAMPDFAHPMTRGERPANLQMILKRQSEISRAAARDPVIHKLMLEVRQMIKPPAAFSDPDIVRRLDALSETESGAPAAGAG
ncbi:MULTISPECIES: NAD(P)/FAD-dependent oxidoreductase [unclassified Sinorhizobium]|uniref:NAD(P)/FAD-dependent oxidoreductase n=1 Tax=unclassified Sinorhizobium TaxID=2613772 RepID=UPI003523CAC1